jgi:hypothetical protein
MRPPTSHSITRQVSTLRPFLPQQSTTDQLPLSSFCTRTQKSHQFSCTSFLVKIYRPHISHVIRNVEQSSGITALNICPCTINAHLQDQSIMGQTKEVGQDERYPSIILKHHKMLVLKLIGGRIHIDTFIGSKPLVTT